MHFETKPVSVCVVRFAMLPACVLFLFNRVIVSLQKRRGVEGGPQAIRDAGLADRLSSLGKYTDAGSGVESE